MELIRQPKREEHWGRQAPTLDDVSTLIEEPCAIVAPNGEPLVSYQHIDAPDLLKRLHRNIPPLRGKSGFFDPDTRTGGLATRSAVFGYSPRLTVRRDYCAASAMTRDYPHVSDDLFALARICARAHHAADPVGFDAQAAWVGRAVKECWRIADTPYTSGIINDTTALAYHRDKGNVAKSWSAMVVLRSSALEGGYLVVPELDVALACSDASLVLFQGEQWWHGVSPIRRRARGADRWSIVFYSMNALRHCGTPAEELQRYKEVRMRREGNRLAGVKALKVPRR